MDIKIAKYLSECGIASRRKSELLVSQGLVFINGKKMDNVAFRIDPKKDKVVFQGKTVKPLDLVYYLLYKPVGTASTTADAHSSKLITSLVPKIPPVWPVGRLDINTSGLILMTNDGSITQKLTHPKYQQEKEYSIITNSPLTEWEFNKITQGLELEDGFIKPDSFTEIKPGQYSIILHSGKKRVVRRIIEKVGKRVAQLKRIRVAFLTLGNLAPGQYRPLAKEEIDKLAKTANIIPTKKKIRP